MEPTFGINFPLRMEPNSYFASGVRDGNTEALHNAPAAQEAAKAIRQTLHQQFTDGIPTWSDWLVLHYAEGFLLAVDTLAGPPQPTAPQGEDAG